MPHFVYRSAALCGNRCYCPAMEQNTAYYITKIKEDLSLRQRVNPHYSLRAYARDLGIHSSTLSQVLKGKRPLPVKISQEFVTKMGLGPKERTYRVKTSIDFINISSNDERFMLDESYSKVIAEWEHYTVLELYDLVDFEMSLDEVSQRLGITPNRADVVITNLITCGLLKHENGKLVRAHSHIRTTEDTKSQALKEAHLETLDIGKKKLEEVDVERRDYSVMTIAMDPDKLPEAKTIIREFRQKMAALLRDGNKKEVYQMAIQLYPLTEKQQL